MEYQERYGISGISRKGVAPDYTRCAEEVHRNYRTYQCTNRAKYDPDENGQPTMCGTHWRQKERERKRQEADARFRALRKSIRARFEPGENGGPVTRDELDALLEGHISPYVRIAGTDEWTPIRATVLRSLHDTYGDRLVILPREPNAPSFRMHVAVVPE